YLNQMGVRVRYMHSDIDSIERMEILRGLRMDEFDVLVGINLLREGLDLPEVSLVAVLDADKEGFLRSETSLIQTAGRAARNVNGTVILYADRVTDSMRRMIDETERRRAIQQEHNERHGIEPETIYKTRDQIMRTTAVADSRGGGAPRRAVREAREKFSGLAGEIEREELAKRLEAEMKAAAEDLDFQTAAMLRDQLFELRGEAAGKRRRPRTLRERIGVDGGESDG
ncbi:MAG: helicase-related protein, partial [Gemmatimonadota bacterium]|nr:helicase-related protein [Gemmatimonadota bacterium]